MQLSIVIITKNEAYLIGQVLQSVQSITDDVIIVDSGSTDNTLQICKQYHATILQTTWDGYGVNKNKGINAAKYDWILSIDADEIVDEKLQSTILKLNLANTEKAFKIHRKNYLGKKYIRFGEWAGDYPVRIFNRKNIWWNNAPVHESLQINSSIKIAKLRGNLLHFTSRNINEFTTKTVKYAKLNSQKYFQQHKNASTFKLLFAPGYNFFYNYILRLGFLDGLNGYLIAKTTAWYTFLKYRYLKELNKNIN